MCYDRLVVQLGVVLMKKFTVILLFIIVVSAFLGANISAHGNYTHEKGISFLDIRRNETGNGYEWNNYDDILTLDNIQIKTEDDYGLKLPHGATVILKGTNYIKASKAAVLLAGKVTFKGDGKLVLEGENGFFCSSNDIKNFFTINNGTYEIKSTGTAIVSEYHRISLNNCNMKITTESEFAIYSANIDIGVNSKIVANSAFYGKDKITLDGADVSITSNKSALESGGDIKFIKVKILAGTQNNALKHTENYSGEACIETQSIYDNTKNSIILNALGISAPVVFDALILLCVFILIACVVALPIYIKSIKTKKAIKLRDEASSK